jgi:hypothetical protein
VPAKYGVADEPHFFFLVLSSPLVVRSCSRGRNVDLRKVLPSYIISSNRCSLRLEQDRSVVCNHASLFRSHDTSTIHPRYIHGLIVYSPLTSYEMLPSCRVRSLRQRSFLKLDLVVSNMYELCFFEQSRMRFLSTPLGIFRFTMQSIQRSGVCRNRNPLLRA